MSDADHLQTNGQTDARQSRSQRYSSSDQLPMVEVALNNAVHASTGFTPFYLNGLRHPQDPDKQKEWSTEKEGKLKYFYKREQQVEASLHWALSGPGKTWRAYTIDLPKSMVTHPTFYVGHLMRYLGPFSDGGRTR
ncbi:Reverse transcriptase [Phytophthora palmivora]|uniref:Reverse transcriptase n=1 Tax=Phytophthora palmivora TaxID=4796 RepID=A0A2P4Y9M2_9STRA|nr:Reverse transcriptase [Phytophthora palmivora]